MNYGGFLDFYTSGFTQQRWFLLTCFIGFLLVIAILNPQFVPLSLPYWILLVSASGLIIHIYNQNRVVMSEG
jgi:hypothetical protein